MSESLRGGAMGQGEMGQVQTGQVQAGQADLGRRFQAGLQQLGKFLGKAGFGIFLLAAAIAALVATTFIGLMLALAAVFLTFAQGIGRSRKSDGPETLEARRSADGWVIEG